jgi:DNA-binding MarR family transcriptional regulator
MRLETRSESTDPSAQRSAQRSAQPSAPRGCTNFKLRQLLRVVGRLYDVELAKAGLKTTQFSLLSHLTVTGPVQPGELALRMDMDASTLTRNLRVLTEQGWAVQGPGVDARSRLIEITAAGRQKVSQAKRHWKSAQLTVNARLGAPQVSALHRLIDIGLEQLRVDERPESTGRK